MATVTLAAVTTLAQAIDEIRERTGSWSERESKLYRLALINLIHDALLLARDQIARSGPAQMAALREFYRTEPASTTEMANLVDISALDIWYEALTDPSDLLYIDASNGVANMMTMEEFENLKTIYTATMMAYFFCAMVANIGSTDGKMQVRTYRGTSLNAMGTVRLGYPRNPVKRTIVTDKLDATETMIRQAIEIVVKWVPSRLKGAA